MGGFAGFSCAASLVRLVGCLRWALPTSCARWAVAHCGQCCQVSRAPLFGEAERLFEMGFAGQLREAGADWLGEIGPVPYMLPFSPTCQPQSVRSPHCPTSLQILGAVGPSRQTLLFSATMPAALAEFARAGLKVRVGEA